MREIAPQADPVTRTQRIKIALNDPPQSFRLGATVAAKLSTMALISHVPASAVLNEAPKARFGWSTSRQQVSLRDIDVSPDATGIQVMSGLDAGTRVVTAGVHSLKEGQQVKIQGTPRREAFNLSEWALEHRSLLWYFMIVFVLAGAFSYIKLGREEDPNFTIKTMIDAGQWPGATAEEVTMQVTERIEKKLEELESLDYTKSITTAGQTTVFVNLLPTTKAQRRQPDLGARAQHDRRHQGPVSRGVTGRSSTTASATSSATSTPSPPTA